MNEKQLKELLQAEGDERSNEKLFREVFSQTGSDDMSVEAVAKFENRLSEVISREEPGGLTLYERFKGALAVLAPAAVAAALALTLVTPQNANKRIPVNATSGSYALSYDYYDTWTPPAAGIDIDEIVEDADIFGAWGELADNGQDDMILAPDYFDHLDTLSKTEMEFFIKSYKQSRG